MIADSKHHYTYRITNILESKHYYGVRSSVVHPKEDLGIKYLSSSSDRDFINDQKENPQNYKYKIVRISETRKQAAQLEVDLHNKFNVGIHESFYNLSTQRSISYGSYSAIKGKTLEEFYGVEKANAMKEKLRYVRTEETKLKMRKPKSTTENMGMPGVAIYINEDGNHEKMKVTEAKERNLVAESKGRKYTDEVNKKKGRKGELNHQYGVPLTAEAKRKIGIQMKDTVTCFDLETGNTLRIPKELFDSTDRYVGSTSRKIKEYYESSKG
jgi:hypothetical protein